MCYSWGATSEYRFKIGDFAPTGAGLPKISGRSGRPHQPCSFQKTRLNGLSYGIKIWMNLSSVLLQSTRLTDGQTVFSSLDRVSIPFSAVKTNGNVKDFLPEKYKHGDLSVRPFITLVSHAYTIQVIDINFPPYDRAMFIVSWPHIWFSWV